MKYFSIKMVVIIERVNREGLICNDNNNEKDLNDLEVQDLDYDEYISRTWLHNYADLINYPYISTYDLYEAEVGYLKDAIPMGFWTGKPDPIFKDELNAIVMRMESEIPPTPPTGWFIRMSSASPKDGMSRTALWSAQDIINQLSTSKRTLISLHKGDRKLYLVPYDQNWEIFRELRVFVRKNKVTAISQYIISKSSLFSAMSNNDLIELANNIITYINSTLPPILDIIGTHDVVCDLYLNPDETFKIIELNSFGYCFSAGAALFHWQNDRDILYGKNDDVYFRNTCLKINRTIFILINMKIEIKYTSYNYNN
jgi:hypothetical protein